MLTLTMHGIVDPTSHPSDLGRGLPSGVVTSKASVRLQSGRVAAPQLQLHGVNPDDVVELELEGGLRLWTRVDDLARDFSPVQSRDSRETISKTVPIPAALPIGSVGRGVAGWAITGLKVLGIDIVDTIGDFVAARVERQMKPGLGLYGCSEVNVAALTPVTRLNGSGPTLVFLHGMASSTAGSFGGLWTGTPDAPIQRLFERYQGRVLAFQHESLTKSPIENAATLANALGDILDKGEEVHLVSHSRGGLVGELLARGMRVEGAPFTPEDLALFKSSDRTRDLTALKHLNATLQKSRFRIGRFVRVACPARGTTLADGRLDRYFSILVNLAALVPGLNGSPAYEALTSVLTGVLKRRTDPKELPGLEAVMPGSPLVLMLNRPGVRATADLHVLGGDLDGTGVFGRLKTLATDLYYRGDHDLVINTPAMLGGIERTTPVRYWVDTGPSVTHFHYFSRADTTGRLVDALAGNDADFHTLEVKPFAVSAHDYRKRATLAQPIVFVLPGTMGSELSIRNRAVWVDPLALARGGLSTLGMKVDGVHATGVVRSAYGALCEYLAATHEVIPFPYDWRQSLEVSAARLREAIDAKLAQAGAPKVPIRLLAHSMGGLVVRAMLGTPAGQKTWARACAHPSTRFIMLGTPNGGSHGTTALLIGRDALVKKLALLDTTHDYQGLLETIAHFDGVLNLLPHDGSLDLYTASDWGRLFRHDVPSDRGLSSPAVESSSSAGYAWTQPSAASLANARRVRDLIRNSPLDPARTVYVAGAAPETASDVVIDESAPPGRRVRVLATAHGDGRVPWSTGIPPRIRTYYADVAHGDLASTSADFPALLDLLMTGTTSKLGTTPPRRARSITDTFELRDPPPSMFPDEEELIASALGSQRRGTTPADTRPRVHVRIVHDNLTNARSPVLVGHYDQDVIIAAEAYLDRQMSGRLSDLHRMELYAGPLRTASVVLNEGESGRQSHHPGAIVAGLGTVGDMTPGNLTATLEHALTTYGAECAGVARRRRQISEANPAAAGTVLAPVTAVLVGSGEAGVTLSDSIQALLRAVAAANARLARTGEHRDGAIAATGSPADAQAAYIDRIDIFELYEDRAIEAVYALRSLSRSPELRHFVMDDLLVHGAEGRQRARYDVGQAWWQRIRVKADGADGELEFEALTQLARAHASLKPTQRRLVDAFVDQAIGTTAFDPALGHTLFELLVPNDFKAYAPDRRNLVLVLNRAAAALPWELLHDRYDQGAPPLSVASGMIRQLLVEHRREPVLRGSTATALVVGNPVVSDQRFPDLPGAAAEGEAVTARLTNSGYRVHSMFGEAAHPTAVLTALHEQPWRILHLAAHGVFEFEHAPDRPVVSGLVLDNGVYLTAAEAEQMRYVPDIVFINCCHLGQTREDTPRAVAFHRLAANLATQFIEMGARAVVAAGWAVDDAAAKAFATTFYDEMFAGRQFGEAIATARRHIYNAHSGTNTWGAYQCYGDPGFSLVTANTTTTREGWVTPSEVTLWATQIAADARGRDEAGCQQLLADLDAGLVTLPASWLEQPDLCGAIACAFGSLGAFERAIERYETVTQSEWASASLRSLEQLANFKVVWADQLSQRSSPDARRASALLREAETLLGQLLEIGETAERFSLLGSLHKRRAMMATGAARKRTLEAMVRAYDAAFDIASRRPGGQPMYPLANRLAAQAVLSWLPGRSASQRAKIGRELKEGLALLGIQANELQGSTIYFDLSARASHLLLSSMVARELGEKTRRQIVAAHADAAQRGVSPRNRISMTDQLRFFAVMAMPFRGRQAATLKAQLQQLAAELR